MTRLFLQLACLLALLATVSAESDWWSWQPLRSTENTFESIDGYTEAAWKEKGLTGSPEASKRTLIRRLYVNVIGLPPSFDEVEAFVQDSDPGAYAKLVERLLASPHYGERWARHWLDVVHYGETHGYDKDKPRMNAWPYRDYVIRAFNEDKPYTQFIKEQIAGDALFPDTVDGIVATGFLAAGPWDFIGHAEVPEEKIDGKVARHLDRDDMVTTTLNAFCSLTVQCAQCHDHKRDPVTMKDYYALQSVFAALDRADRKYDADPDIAKKRAALLEKERKALAAITEGERVLEDQKSDEVRALEARLAELEKAGKNATRLGYHSEVASDASTEKWVQVDLGKSRAIDEVWLHGAQEYGFADFGFPRGFQVAVSDSSDFKEPTILLRSSDHPRPGDEPVVVPGKEVRGRYVRVTATALWNRRQKGAALTKDWIFALGELQVLVDGKPAEITGVTALDSIEASLRWAKENVRDGFYARSSQGSIQALRRERDGQLKALAPETLAQLQGLREQLKSIRAALAELPEPQKVYVGKVHTGSGAFKGRGHVQGKPRPIHVLHRGDVTMPKQAVVPATVPGIVSNLPVVFQLPEDHEESERRVALSEWIAHPENTLTWRSIVNRVWHYHFGRGLVETPNDFGRIGAKPSHPELLDWLAIKFRDGGGSLKDLHRWILNSAVYKQASANRAAMAAIDSSNQFLWRQNRRRLEAEAIRDSVLAVAGKLDLSMHGPSFMDFVIERPEHSPHYEYHKADPSDPKTHRRSIYRFLVRSQPQPFMQAFDCADPSELVDRRGETNTALQALAMLNNKLMVHMASCFADRLAHEKEPVRAAVRLALSREPTEEETAALGAYAKAHGHAAMCRLLFNLNEFTFID